MAEKIILDPATFKALASESRISMLKHLLKRRYTQSEIAALMDISVPTAKEHLSALENAGLVKMIDEGRKWKYYALTDKGKAIGNPEVTENPIREKKFWIMLAGLGLSAAGWTWSYVQTGVGTIGTFGQTQVVRTGVQEMVVPQAAMDEGAAMAEAFVTPAMASQIMDKAIAGGQAIPWALIGFSIAIAFFAALLLGFWIHKRRYQLRV